MPDLKGTKTHGNLLIDIRSPYFGNNAGLVLSDFQAGTSKNKVGILSSAPTAGVYRVKLRTTAYQFINLTGKTQFRLRFAKGDNDDLARDLMKIFSGDAPSAKRPRLIIEYYVP